mmetsp:Transcript_19947/g.41838  ORF Transcript_19947/g.41838 Transcript_19947/m.41838 type:complete len:80 (+) Transcript_19947:166-405(+)
MGWPSNPHAVSKTALAQLSRVAARGFEAQAGARYAGGLRCFAFDPGMLSSGGGGGAGAGGGGGEAAIRGRRCRGRTPLT